jgi:hypothetical protein
MATRQTQKQRPPTITPQMRAAANARRRERLEALAPTRCPDIMTLEEAMIIAKVGDATIRKAIELGYLRARNLGGSAGIRITRRALYDWLEGISGHFLAEFALLGAHDPVVDEHGRTRLVDRVLSTEKGEKLARELMALINQEAEAIRMLHPEHPDTSENPDAGADAPLLEKSLSTLLDHRPLAGEPIDDDEVEDDE